MAFVDPRKTADTLELMLGMQIADFGCGSGYWAVALAQKVGSSGKVFAIDILPQALEATRSQAKLQNVHNIETVQANLEIPQATKLKDGMLDVVMLSSMLAQADHREIVAAEAYRILKPNGRVVVVEWDMTDKKSGPPLQPTIARRDMEHIFKDAGFTFQKEFSAGSYHYGLVFKK